jgi:hypothetical protein
MAFLDEHGCPTSLETGQVFFDVEEDTAARTLTDPQVTHVEDNLFIVSWRSRAADLTIFDDRIRARLVQLAPPHFAANVESVEGATIDLDIDDRWIEAQSIQRVLLPNSAHPALCVVWYARSGREGRILLALFNERLARISPIIELDRDQDEGASVTDKATAATALGNTVFVTWTRSAGPEGGTTLLGRRVELTPEIRPGSWFTLASGAEVFGATLTNLGENLVAVWRANSGLDAAVLRASGEPRFTNFGDECGPSPFSLVTDAAFRASTPVALRTGNSVQVLFDRTELATAARGETWAIGLVSFSEEDLLHRKWWQ